MKKIGPIPLEQLVKDDVNRVIQHASIIISLTPEGPMIFANPKPTLNVLAVIGPGIGTPFKRFFERALLLEVGIGVGRPYHEAKSSIEKTSSGKPKSIPKRRKWFRLTEQQYIQVASWIFPCLQEITNQKVANWKCNHESPFFIPTSRHYFSRHQKTLFIEEGYKSWPRGTRFAVSLEDRFLLSDIYWAEKHNPDLRRRLKGLAKFIDLRLNFSGAKKTKSRPRKEFRELKRFVQVAGILEKRNLPVRHIVDLLDFLPLKNGRSRSLYYYEISHLLGYTGEEFREEKFVHQALANPSQRLNGIKLRITTGLSCRDHIVFEISTNLPVGEEMPLPAPVPK